MEMADFAQAVALGIAVSFGTSGAKQELEKLASGD